MANTATLAVKIVSDSSAARADIGKSSDAVGKWGDRAGKVGKTAGKILAGGILLAAGAAVKFTQAAAEDAASAQKLSDALKQTTGATDDQVASVEKWIEAQGKALGVADDELRPALSRLAGVTKDVGKAQKLASLAMDISARTGKPLKTVVEGLAKAQTGSITGLAKFGVQVKNSKGDTKSLDKIMRDLSKTYSGSAAKAADTAAGRQKRLTVAMDELQEKIGAKLLPVMEKLIDVGFKVIAWIDKNQKLVGILVIALGGFLAIVYVITTAVRIWTAVQLAWNTVMALNPIGLIVIAVVALVAAIIIAYKKSDTFRALVQKVGEVGKEAWDKIKSALEPLIDVLAVVVKWVADKLPAAWSVAKTLIVGYIKLITLPWRLLFELIKVVWGWVKDKVPAAFNAMKGPVVKALDIVTKPWQIMFGVISDVFTWVKEKVPAAFETLKDKAQSIAAALIAPFKKLYDLLVSAINRAKELARIGKDGSQSFPFKVGGFPAPSPTVPPGTGRDPVDPRLATAPVMTVNVTVEGGIIGMTDETVGRAVVDAVNRGRRAAGLPPLLGT